MEEYRNIEPASPRNFTELRPLWREAVENMVIRMGYANTIANRAHEARRVRINRGWFDFGTASDYVQPVPTPEARAGTRKAAETPTKNTGKTEVSNQETRKAAARRI